MDDGHLYANNPKIYLLKYENIWKFLRILKQVLLKYFIFESNQKL